MLSEGKRKSDTPGADINSIQHRRSENTRRKGTIKKGRLAPNSVFNPPYPLTKEIFKTELTANIAIWIFKQLNKLGETRRYVEIEMRLGKIIHASHTQKSKASYISDAILEPTYAQHTTFKIGSSSQEMSKALRNAEKLVSESNIPPRIVKTDSVDKLYKIEGIAGDVRVSFKKDGEVSKPIVKKKLESLIISLPGLDNDFKIAIAVELPVDDGDLIKANFDLASAVPRFTRHKRRTEYIFDDQQICLTSVEMKNEIEVELNSTMLLQKYSKCKRKNPKNPRKETEWLQLEQLAATLVETGVYLVKET